MPLAAALGKEQGPVSNPMDTDIAQIHLHKHMLKHSAKPDEPRVWLNVELRPMEKSLAKDAQ